MAKVALDIATKEVENWLEYKKVQEKTIEINEDSAEILAGAVAEGILKIDDKTHVITHKLLWEIGEDEKIKELTYIPRVNDKILSPYMKGIKPTDSDARLNAYIRALTKQPSGIIKAIDSVDKKISVAIAVFFL